jgi:hypothetical protein
MKQFWKKSPDQLTTTLAQLRLRADALADKRAAAEAALAAATEARQSHRLDGDLTDEKLDAKLQANVDLCQSKLAGLDADLAALQAKIADTEQQLAAEHAAAERKAASEKLARDLDAVEKALPTFLEGGRRFVSALEGLRHHFEATQMGAFTTNVMAQIETAAAFSLVELRGMVNAIANGYAPIPPKPQPAEAVLAPEPAPPTMEVFMLKSAHYRDHDGRKRFAGQWQDATMPVATAQKALRLGAAVSTADPRRAQLRGTRGGDYRSDAVDVVDIDEAVEHSGISFIGPNKSDVIAEANFVETRGHERKGVISVYRV